jgi:protein required for attachment to host cells
MQIPHNAHVLVADGRKMLFFRNEGDGEFPNLQLEKKDVHPNPKDSEQKTDLAGQSSSTRSGPGAPPVAQNGSNHARGSGAQFASGGGTMGETDYHQLEEDKFAAETADLLKRRALNNEIESLIIVAPPQTLGELRKHYHKEVEARIAGEIAKDLTNMPVPEIEKVLQAS